MQPRLITSVSALLLLTAATAAQAEKNKSVALSPVGLPPAPHPVHVLPPPTTAKLQELARKAYPTNHYQRAMYLRQRGDLDGALIEFLRAVQENPKQVRAFYEQAVIFKSKGYTKLAQSALEQALAVQPDFREARVLLASVFLESGDFSNAARQLGKSLGLEAQEKKRQPLTGQKQEANAAGRKIPPPMVLQVPHGSLPEPPVQLAQAQLPDKTSEKPPQIAADHQVEHSAQQAVLPNEQPPGAPELQTNVENSWLPFRKADVDTNPKLPFGAENLPPGEQRSIVEAQAAQTKEDHSDFQLSDLLKGIPGLDPNAGKTVDVNVPPSVPQIDTPIATAMQTARGADENAKNAPDPLTETVAEAGKQVTGFFEKMRKGGLFGLHLPDMLSVFKASPDTTEADKQPAPRKAAEEKIKTAQVDESLKKGAPAATVAQPVETQLLQEAVLPESAPDEKAKEPEAPEPIAMIIRQQESRAPGPREQAAPVTAASKPANDSSIESLLASVSDKVSETSTKVAEQPPRFPIPVPAPEEKAWLPSPVDVSHALKKAVAWMPMPLHKLNPFAADKGPKLQKPVADPMKKVKAPAPELGASPPRQTIPLPLPPASTPARTAGDAPVPMLRSADGRKINVQPTIASTVPGLSGLLKFLPKDVARNLASTSAPAPVDIPSKGHEAPAPILQGVPKVNRGGVPTPSMAIEPENNPFEETVLKPRMAPAPKPIISQPTEAPRPFVFNNGAATPPQQAALPKPTVILQTSGTPAAPTAVNTGNRPAPPLLPSPIASALKFNSVEPQPQAPRTVPPPMPIAMSVPPVTSGKMAPPLAVAPRAPSSMTFTPAPVPVASAAQPSAPDVITRIAQSIMPGLQPQTQTPQSVPPVPLQVRAVMNTPPPSRSAQQAPVPQATVAAQGGMTALLPQQAAVDTVPRMASPNQAATAQRLASQGFKFIAPKLAGAQDYVLKTAKPAAPKKPVQLDGQAMVLQRPLPVAPKPAAPPEDEYAKRMKYLVEHGTESLGPGEAFMFAEDTGEGVLFLPGGKSVRRVIAGRKDIEEVIRQRRPDIIAPTDLQYNLSLLGKILTKNEVKPQPAPAQPINGLTVKEILNQSQTGVWGWFRNVFKL